MEYTFDSESGAKEQFAQCVNSIYSQCADMTFAERKFEVDALCAAWQDAGFDIKPNARDVERLGTIYLWGEMANGKRSR